MEKSEKLIIATIDKIRPFLQRDGGDCEFIKFEEGIVYVKMHGACVGCSAIDITVKDTIEVILQEEVEGVIAVQVI